MHKCKKSQCLPSSKYWLVVESQVSVFKEKDHNDSVLFVVGTHASNV